MALDVGTLVGHLDLDDSKYNRKLEGASKGIAGFAGTMGKVVAGGALVAGTAVAGFAAKGLKDFGSFQSGMNEVFTLLPGMSKEAMGKLSDDTRNFVKEMGVAHDEAVPALYSALSAGVPADNVFDFMEVAAKAAKGGVTDLNTAVDGITSVVNSYGDSLEGAGEASDLMFTAVRLGKTTFDELSASLFQVNPTAAALGVGFEDVTASLAVMTAQGVPTSVATTQLRQAMVELSKDGGATADVFKEIAGKSFKDFIAEGGNTGEALQMLADHAEDTGVGVNDLFGSVEAGNAALALTGENSAKFDSALAEMRGSAGATDAAFEQMDQGLERSWERIKIGAQDAAIGLGEQLAPAVAGVADWFEEKLPAAIDTFGAWISDMVTWFQEDLPAAVDTAVAWFDDWKGVLDALTPYFEDIVGWVQDKIPAAVDTGVAAGEDLSTFFGETLPTAIQDTITWFEDNIETIKNVATVITVVLMPALVRLGIASLVSAGQQVVAWTMAQAGAIKTGAVYVIQSAIMVGKWVLMGTQALIHAGRMAAAWFIAMGPVGWVIGAIIGLAALVIANWDTISTWTKNTWESITAWVSDAWTNITTAVTVAVEWVRSWIETKIGDIKRNWEGTWDAISGKASDIWDGIKTTVSDAWTNLKTTFDTLIDFVKTAIPDAFESAKDGAAKNWKKLQEAVKEPVRFVVEDIINKGLIGTFNGVLRMVNLPEIPDLKLPKGFAKGGLAHGWAMVGEEGPELVNFTNPGRVYTAKQSAEMLGAAHDEAHGLGSPMPGSSAHIWGPPQAAAKRSGVMKFHGLGTFPMGLISGAASAWNGLAGVRAQAVKHMAGWGANSIGVRYGQTMFPNWIGQYMDQGITIRPNQSKHLATLIHEMGHALGINHNQGAFSVMNPVVGGGGAIYPTGYDAGNLRSLYGPAGTSVTRQAPTAPGPGGPSAPPPEDVGRFNPFDGLLDSLMEKIKEKFPGGGLFVDVAGAIAKTGITKVVDFVADIAGNVGKFAADVAGNVVDGIKKFFGGGEGPQITPTVFDGGGWLHNTGGAQIVQHNKPKPDAVIPYDEFQVMKAAAMGNAGPTIQVNGTTDAKTVVQDVFAILNFEAQKQGVSFG